MIGVCGRRAGGVSPPSQPSHFPTGLRPLGGLTPPARLLVLFVLAALLVLPIFAHGCHGDVDDEPQAAPPTARIQRDARP